MHMLRRKEGNILVNNTVNTFCLWLYGVGYIVHTTAFVTPVVEHWLEHMFRYVSEM